MFEMENEGSPEAILEAIEKLKEVLASARLDKFASPEEKTAELEEAMEGNEVGNGKSVSEKIMEGEEGEDPKAELKKYLTSSPSVPRRPGTAMMIAVEKKKMMPKKGKM